MSPRPGPARPVLTMRMSQDGIARLDALAKAAGITRSELIRRLLKLGMKHWR